jgi:hypothetical protein
MPGPETPGSCVKVYVFTCAICGRTGEYWAKDKGATKATAQRYMRMQGWTLNRRMGWIHADCFEAELELCNPWMQPT